MSIKNIFFDFDGVLAESVNVKTDAFYELYLPYGSEIARKVVAHHRNNGGVSRFEKFRIYHREFLGIDLSEAQVQEMAKAFSNLVVSGVIKSQEVPGATAFLEKYHTKMHFWIISGTPTSEMRHIVDMRNLSKYFEGVCGSPSLKHEWTDKLIDEFQLDRDQTLFLGDAFSDYNAAVHSGIQFALREYDENRELFKSYDLQRFSDFYDLEKKLHSNRL